jgi:hypothetical protein
MSSGRIFKLLQSCETESLPVLLNRTHFNESEPFTISGHFHNDHTPDQECWLTGDAESSPIRLKLEDGQLLPQSLKEHFDFDKLACKPLHEVDADYAKAQVCGNPLLLC